MNRHQEALYSNRCHEAHRKVAEQDIKRARRTTAKPGHTYFFDTPRLQILYVTNAAPFLPSSPIVDGVRMRYDKGRLVPRVRG